MDSQLLPGQTFTGKHLIYVTAGDDGALWFCDSSGRHGSLRDLPAHHTGLQVPKNLLEPEDWVLQLSAARWSRESIRTFTGASNAVSADAVWRATAEHVSRYFTGSPDVIALAATYILSTYLFTVADTVPYLHIVGDPASGKTVLGEVFERLCFGARQAASVTSAAMYRLVDATTGTLIIDEQSSGSRRWRNILLSGYRRSGAVLTCTATHPALHRCYGPKILITNEGLGDSALESRCIVLALEPATGRTPRRVGRVTDAEAQLVRDQLHAFGLAYAARVDSQLRARPEIPDITNREDDLAALLLAVARCVDASSAQGSLTDRLVTLFQRSARERKANHQADAERFFLARAILEYATDPAVKRTHTRAGAGWYVAREFADYLSAHPDSQRAYQAKDLGERLNRHRLVSERRVVEIAPQRNTGDGKQERVQRRAYRFDFNRAEQLAGVHS